MKKVFVSGCYDIIHGGHIEFFKQAKKLGDYLVVSVASEASLYFHKKRKVSIPTSHKVAILSNLSMIDEVVIGDVLEKGLDFKEHFLRICPDILAVTVDDRYEIEKRQLCDKIGCSYVVLEKNRPDLPVSTSDILKKIKSPDSVPLRVDFAGGWLDVPKLAKKGGYIVNCTIKPAVSLYEWNYELCSGLGGSGAWSMLNGRDGIEEELNNRVGWQDPAIIQETGLCVWRSGEKPVLHFKRNPDFLNGKLFLYWTNQHHETKSLVDKERNYDRIFYAGCKAKDAVVNEDFFLLCEAIKMSYDVQLEEGMKGLPDLGEDAKKYCGGGHGGYALYMFEYEPKVDGLFAVTPYMRFA